MKVSKSKSKPSKKSQKPINIPSNHLDYHATREYYGVVKRGKLEEYEPGNPIVYKLDEVEYLRRDYPRAKVVKIRMTLTVISEVTL
jgi:UDP-N-acetylmuramoylalanine-D-glutamate ligase